jgi:hypothetical protein
MMTNALHPLDGCNSCQQAPAVSCPTPVNTAVLTQHSAQQCFHTIQKHVIDFQQVFFYQLTVGGGQVRAQGARQPREGWQDTLEIYTQGV